jgi:hypothetical protein
LQRLRIIIAFVVDQLVAGTDADPGRLTQPIEACYMANAWLQVRDSDYDQLRRILDDIGQSLKVHAA